MTSVVHAQQATSFAESVVQNKKKNDQFSLLDSKMEKDFGDGLSIYSNNIKNNSVSPCNNSVVSSLGDRAFMQIMKQATGVTGQLFCFEKIVGMKDPYSAEYCQNVSGCASSILGDLDKLTQLQIKHLLLLKYHLQLRLHLQTKQALLIKANILHQRKLILGECRQLQIINRMKILLSS